MLAEGHSAATPVFPLAALPSAAVTTSTAAFLLAANRSMGVCRTVPIWEPGFPVRNQQSALGLPVCSYDFGRRSRCTGKERDAETGLDYFEARYFSGAQGRFASSDPLVWQNWQRGDEEHQQMFADFIANPQNFNQYAYVLNDPLSSTDPTGLYTCSGTEEQCKNVEAQLVEARKSQDSKVSRGAAAYGAAGEDNGVRVSFSDRQAAGHGNTGFVQVVNASTGKSSTEIGVVLSAIQFSGAGAGTSVTAGAVVVHEGSHVADDQAALFNATLFPGLPNPANITHAQSEVQAYLTGAAFIAEHGGTQASPLVPGLRLNTPGTIGVFLQTAPSGRPPYRAYPQEVLWSPIY